MKTLRPYNITATDNAYDELTTLIRKVCVTIGILLLTAFCSSAQKRETGKEAVKASIRFSDVVHYYKAHPQRLTRKELENENDDLARPSRPKITDQSLLRHRVAPEQRTSGPSAPMPLLPVSTAPADTFEATLDNNYVIPPDTHGGVDANYCVTATNSAIHIQTRSGSNISSVSLDQFWSAVLPGGGSFDPRIHYDPTTGRWFLVSVSGAGSSSASSVLIAVTKTGDPTGAWWLYKVTAVPTGTYWLDFPNVGFNKNWLAVTGNLFTNISFGGAKTYLFNKAALMSGTAASYTSFVQTSSFSISPAVTYDATQNSLFAVESWNGTYGYMHVWKITGAVGAESMTSVSYPVSSQLWWYESNTVTGSAGADFLPQSGTTRLIQANDDRVSQTIFMNNRLWFAHTIFLPYSATANPTRTAVQWWQTDTLGNPLQIGRIDDASGNNFYAFPSIAVNNNDDALVGFSAFSGTTHPSAAYALHQHTDPADSMRPLQVYRHGGNTYYKTYGGTRNRWGDYSGTVTDPTNMTDFWTIQEAVAGIANTWDTWWAHIPLSGCSVAAITGAGNVCAGSTATLSDATPGGTWASGNTTVASINASTGVLTGSSAGTATITYTAPGGCTATTVEAVIGSPSAGVISGPTSVAVGANITLSESVTGGTWSSSNTAVATVGTNGIVSGVSVGTALISYAVNNGCGAAYTTTTITVIPNTNHAPAFIGGASQPLVVCQNSSATSINSLMAISDADAGQTETWTVVSGPSHGTLAGFPASNMSTGSTVIPTGLTYKPTTGYSGMDAFTIRISDGIASATTTVNVTVQAPPTVASIGGASNVSVGGTITLTDATPGGTWSSANPTIATVSTGGVVTGVSTGYATISYKVTNTCGSASATKRVKVSRSGHKATSDPLAEVTVYPNPTTGTFTLTVPGDGTFYLVSLDGRVIGTHNVTEGDNQLTIPPGTPAGMCIGKYVGIDRSTFELKIIFKP